jgi:hypothetical protein
MTSRDIQSYYEATIRSLGELQKAINCLDLDTTAKDRGRRLDAVAFLSLNHNLLPHKPSGNHLTFPTLITKQRYILSWC